MNAVVAALIAGIGTGVPALTVAILSYRQATAANRASTTLETRKVDAEAFTSAQAIYKDAIATLEAQLVAARERISDLERRIGGVERSAT